MPLQENELARREGGTVALRARPLRVRWDLGGLSTADGRDLRCTFVASVRAVPDPLDRRMLAEVLLAGRDAISADDVRAHFSAPLAAAAAKAASRFAASAWTEGDEATRAAMVDALAGAAKPVAFASGVELLAPFETEFQSLAHQQERLRAVQQAIVEKQAAGEIEQVQRAGHLLREFQALRQSMPGLSAGAVLAHVGPADRGSMLRSLLLAGAQQAAPPRLWAVAGPYLVRIDSPDGSIRPELLPLPPTLGPLRSVQSATIDGGSVLLIGAQGGVMCVRPGETSEPQLFHVPGLQSRLGFNQVVFLEVTQQICASHAEAGVVLWDRTDQTAPRATLPPAQLGMLAGSAAPRAQGAATIVMSSPSDSSASIIGSASASPGGPRNLFALGDGSVLFSVGGALFRWDGVTPRSVGTRFPHDVVAILPIDAQSLGVVLEDGTVQVSDRGSPDKVQSTLRRGVRVRAAALLPWLEGARLLLATDAGPLQCIGLEDGIVTEYLSAYRRLRMVSGSATAVAAVSSDRQRVIVWNSWDGRQPAGEFYLMGLTRHRIADIDFGQV